MLSQSKKRGLSRAGSRRRRPPIGPALGLGQVPAQRQRNPRLGQGRRVSRVCFRVTSSKSRPPSHVIRVTSFESRPPVKGPLHLRANRRWRPAPPPPSAGPTSGKPRGRRRARGKKSGRKLLEASGDPGPQDALSGQQRARRWLRYQPNASYPRWPCSARVPGRRASVARTLSIRKEARRQIAIEGGQALK